MKQKYQIGDLVRLNKDVEGYDVIVDETDLTYEDIGLITNFVSGQVTNTIGGKPIVHRDWYDVMFHDKTISLEEWEIEPL